ncbi:MerR family transcriptional regulator [Streptomyces sp. TLI_105]|uniref:MerR family transcriptional regulator n=1 Tax=Streptomyces sp. TLI_105 TaxID=1881019 RepID=UPI000895BDB6|nr:MerR family transcriptional regulator [Streptomyces sp. TLI_105]SEB74265.1 DNA-binding transcriptional regulator, MerR family [Streptomyces sp. TLI_105]
MSSDGLWSIGELAARAGVTVKTVRFYSDRGLLPEAVRSSGGHRRYGAEALDRLRFIRSLRALDLPVPEVERVLEGDGADAVLEEAVAGRLRDVGSQLVALRWKEASLRLLQECAAGERAQRLRLLGALPAPPDTDALVRFWRRALPVRLPGRVVATVLDAVVPRPPEEPGPGQVLAFARLHALVTDPRLERPEFRPAPPLPDGEYRPVVLYEGLAEAYGLASAEVRAGRAPQDGGALDCFVSAYARARGEQDTPDFRRRLVGLLALDDSPVLPRYWKLAAGLFAPDEPVLGMLHHHLSTALRGQVQGPAA